MIVLASQSPRRRELLESAGIPFTVRASNIDETILDGENPVDYVRRMAKEKAFAVDAGPDEIVLAADTTVACGGQILGKPRDADDAVRMLHLLSGNCHTVLTGICLRRGRFVSIAHDETRVWFIRMTARDIEDYVATGEPMDKAGAYAVQGLGSRFVEKIEGSYSNVVGLPVWLVRRELENLRTCPSPAASTPQEA